MEPIVVEYDHEVFTLSEAVSWVAEARERFRDHVRGKKITPRLVDEFDFEFARHGSNKKHAIEAERVCKRAVVELMKEFYPGFTSEVVQ
jgi:hypothetical protein